MIRFWIRELDRSAIKLYQLLAALLLFFFETAHSQTLPFRVVRVLNGDTLSVHDTQKREVRVRLSGIDAPEGGQIFGNKSTQALSDCALGKVANIKGDKLDSYGRTVARVIVDGMDCNLRQIELGMAWYSEKYADAESAVDAVSYVVAEQIARTSKKGLWIDPNAVAPWIWLNSSPADKAAAREPMEPCHCDIAATCKGPNGGVYCLTRSGVKRYLPKRSSSG
jgi:endonuclease YncB( thermonuclease family)